MKVLITKEAINIGEHEPLLFQIDFEIQEHGIYGCLFKKVELARDAGAKDVNIGNHKQCYVLKYSLNGNKHALFLSSEEFNCFPYLRFIKIKLKGNQATKRVIQLKKQINGLRLPRLRADYYLPFTENIPSNTDLENKTRELSLKQKEDVTENNLIKPFSGIEIKLGCEYVINIKDFSSIEIY